MDKFDTKILEIIGLNVRKLRRENKLSQAQLAFEANLTREFVNKLEAGRLNISVLKLNQIALVLSVDITALFEHK